MTKHISAVLGLALIVSLLGAPTNATAASGIISYYANANPTNVDGYVTQPGNQFWSGPNSFGAGPVGTGINDGGTLAWDVSRSTVGAGEEFWTQTPLAADVATGNVEGWKLSTRLRLPSTGLAASTGAMLAYADGSKQWEINFGTDADGDPIVKLVDGATNPSFTLEGAGNGGYHDYVLAYSPLAGTADLYVDNVLRISGFNAYSVGFTRLLFGDAAMSSTDQDARYNSVLLVLPEPSSSSLLLVGAILLVRRWSSRS